MRVLAVDSSSPAPALALLSGADEEDTETIRHGEAERLVSSLRSLLSRARVEIRDLERIAVLSGPGSFTGLRAGIAFTRGLARALEVPHVARSTFQAASAALSSPADVVFLLDAGRGEAHRAVRRSGALEENERPVPHARALEEAAALGLPVRDLGAEPLPLASALARLARDAREDEVVSARYGRPSAAEEKLLAREAR
jgi:tRNA threonylcarbamoyladenosine biosynthesis protein TsaB